MTHSLTDNSRWLSFGDLSLLLRGRWGREAWGEAIFFLGKGKRTVAVERENSRYFTLRWARESRPCCSCWCARCRWNSCSTCTWAFTLYLSTWRRVIVLRQIRRGQMFSWRSWKADFVQKMLSILFLSRNVTLWKAADMQEKLSVVCIFKVWN